MNSRFKLCTFDVTNTLLKFQSCVGEQYAKIGRMYGIERDPNQVAKAFEHHWKVMNTKHPNYGRNTGLSSRQWWREILERSFMYDSSEFSKHQLDSISNDLYNLYKGDTCWEVTPGAESLLTHLKQKQIKLGVISNFDERLDSVLTATGLKSYFDFILASYVVQVAKPSKEIFNLALAEMSGVIASNALHVGDNMKLDYLAAKEAGWNALLLAAPDSDIKTNALVDANDVVYNVDAIEKFVLCL